MNEKVLVKRKELGGLKANLMESKPFTYLLLSSPSRAERYEVFFTIAKNTDSPKK